MPVPSAVFGRPSSDSEAPQQRANNVRIAPMRYLLLILLAVAILLWIERFYWKRTAQLLELRVLGEDRSRAVTSLFDAWLDGRIEARLRRKRAP